MREATVGPISNSGTLGAEHYSAERISSFNKIIRMLGVNVIDLAEVGDGGWLPSKLTSDGVHLNADGYVRWKEAMRRGC